MKQFRFHKFYTALDYCFQKTIKYSNKTTPHLIKKKSFLIKIYFYYSDTVHGLSLRLCLSRDFNAFLGGTK